MPFSKDARESLQGTHRCFLTTMSWGELQQMAVFPEDLQQLDEDEQMQRGYAKKRIGDLVDYLLEAKDHFFSALTLIVMPRDLEQPAQEGAEGQEDWDFFFEKRQGSGPGVQRSGVLHISGSAQVFPADGQHRLRAGIEAMKKNPKLAKEEVPVVLLPYKNPDVVRQLFSDLNLNAKPVSKTIGYAFESRDQLTQLAKHLANSIPLFDDRVNRVTNSLSFSSAKVITLGTLVECTKDLAVAFARTAGYEQKDGKEAAEAYLHEQGEAAEVAVKEAMETIISSFEGYWGELNEVTAEGEPATTPGKLREEYVFPHGIGWRALSSAAATMMAEFGDAWQDLFRETVEAIDWSRTAKAEWNGKAVVYDDAKGTNRVNNTGPGISATAGHIVATAHTVAASTRKGARTVVRR